MTLLQIETKYRTLRRALQREYFTTIKRQRGLKDASKAGEYNAAYLALVADREAELKAAGFWVEPQPPQPTEIEKLKGRVQALEDAQ